MTIKSIIGEPQSTAITQGGAVDVVAGNYKDIDKILSGPEGSRKPEFFLAFLHDSRHILILIFESGKKIK